jgi:hypothetical protein
MTYGVVVTGEPLRVDERATTQQREAIRAERRRLAKPVSTDGYSFETVTR